MAENSNYVPFEANINLSTGVEYKPFESNIQNPLPMGLTPCNCCDGVQGDGNIYTQVKKLTEIVDKLKEMNTNLENHLNQFKDEYNNDKETNKTNITNLNNVVKKYSEIFGNAVRFYGIQRTVQLRANTVVNNVLGSDNIESWTGIKGCNGSNTVVICNNSNRKILDSSIFALNYYPQSTTYGYWTMKLDQAPTREIEADFTFLIIRFGE